MSWWQVLPVVVGAVGLILLPGYVVAAGCGAKGMSRLGLAAPLTTSVVSMSAIVAGALRSDWSLWWLVLPTLALAIGGVIVRHFTGARRPRRIGLRGLNRPSLRSAVLFLAVTLSGAIIGWRLTQLFGRPESVSQTYDGVFHLNALRYIMDTGSASSLSLGGMPTGGDDPSFYPAAWHGLVSLLIQATDTSIPVAVNATSIAVGAIVWPIGCIFLCTRITGNRPIPVLVTGVLASGFSAFPYLLLDFGVLYPNFLSVALLPACVALAAMVLRVSSDNRQPWMVSFLALLASLPGLGLAHPSTLMALAALFLPLGGVAMVRHWRQLRRRRAHAARFIPSFAALVCYTAAVVVLWQELRPSETASQWEPFQTNARAVGEILAAAPMGEPAAWMIMFLTFAGLLHIVLKRGTWWGFGIFLVTAFLYVVASSEPQGDFRNLITGVWYNDSFRLAALLPVTTIVLASIGGSWIVTATAQHLQERGKHIVLQRVHPRLTTTVPAIAATITAVAVLVPLVQGPSVSVPVREAHRLNYDLNEESALSVDERELIGRLPQHVPDDAVVAGNPWSGMAYAYALSGVEVLTPHLGTTGAPENLQLLMELDQAATNPAICPLLESTGVQYVLEFAGKEIHAGDHFYPGVEGLAGQPGLRVLDSEGQATLYEITTC
ncbi:hypothetical protein GCM10027404_04400 [Arthrobacter tumbae]|uniref:DUF6541 family protein n=1 Tax=Arthrobacter tumbae TaxID=163874 RepID=UPI0027DAC6E5|nr:DUF6541 family protein [Arthrobacter tumbae]